MIRSMTGYGKGQAARAELAIVAEVRSVNGRSREVRLRLPSELASLEPSLREQVQRVVMRGRVDVAIRWAGANPQAGTAVINRPLARALLSSWQQLAEELGLDPQLGAAELLRLPGVVELSPSAETDLDCVHPIVSEALALALETHRQAREREGAALGQDLAQRARQIVEQVGEIRTRAAQIPARLAQTFRIRLEALLGEVPLDPDRLTQEAAIMAQRADVTEELTRLDAHLARLTETLTPQASEVGSKIEFLVQEIRREINTLTVKSADPAIDERSLRIKTELERLREQAANLE